MNKVHPLLPNLDDEIVSTMMKAIGISSIEELFSDIPPKLRLRRKLRLPKGKSEQELRREIQDTLSLNKTPPNALCFLGGGVWPHYVPAVIDSVVSRQEFYTSYTPYQPEISQGMLQALFEYQSLMCELLGMEACNSSMYDWASAAGEAVRMAIRVTGRKRIVIAGNIGPSRLEVIKSYIEPITDELKIVKFDKRNGQVDLESLKSTLGNNAACFYFENPNYFGVIEEEAQEVVEITHSVGALAIVGLDPTSLSLIREPGSYNADIAVGEGQPLGIYMNYGGPHLGIFAVKDLRLARSMPGRLIGMTTTKDSDQKAFSMVLQTREQHIRREAATSNICTNQALMAVAAACYLSLLGKIGFRRLGEVIISNSHYAAKRLSKISGLISPLFEGQFFKEFVIGYSKKGVKSDRVFKSLSRMNIFAGYPIDKRFNLGLDAGLYCVTELHNYDDIERLANALEEVL